jgi:hypothetical protein
MKHRKMTKQQKANAKKSAKSHGRGRPGLWENVNASKGRGPKQKKGKTRPGRRSKTRKTGAQKRRARR